MKWDVPLEGKQRKLQFLPSLLGSVKEVTSLKEMFELNFAMPSDQKWNIVWDNISNPLHL
ncbi:BnaA06g20470D [Brassica napus]|uniref:BnaA06g20470D protein n=1 Tax=Brassica napus TaxID=3708 RepID=A0A078GAP0_BRANA|nr:BnaA06g20470D [Brassica napus]